MDMFTSLWEAFSGVITSILPLSPFRQYVEYIAQFPYLSWINWFIPMSSLIAITEVWLIAVSAYYTWLYILRWFKLVE